MIRTVALFTLVCAISSAVAYCLLKAYTDGRVEVVQKSLENLSAVHEASQKEVQKEIAELKARVDGKAKGEAGTSAAIRVPDSPKPLKAPSVAEQPLAVPAERIEDIVITNSAGDIFRNLKLSRVTPDGLLFEHTTGLVKAKWSELPVWCQLKYLDAALDAASKDRQTGRGSTQLAPQSTRTQRDDADTHTGLSWLIKGPVIQKTRDGLFVQSGGGQEPAEHGGAQVFAGLCLLKGHPEQVTFAEGDQVNIRAKESGLYQYTAVSGAVRSIRQFTAY